MPTSLPEFIRAAGITADAESIPHRADLHGSDWGRDARHWTVTLRCNGAALPVPFSQGSAHTEPPTAADVLYCLRLDVDLIDQDFEDWAADLGYDTDSRKAYAQWEACQREAVDLRGFLGDDLFAALMAVEED